MNSKIAIFGSGLSAAYAYAACRDNGLNRMEFLNRIELNQFTRIYQPPASAPDNLHFIGKWAEWNPYRRFDQIYEIVKGILNE